MDMAKMGLKNLAQGNKPWAAGPLGHRSTRVPCLRTMDYQTFWPLQRERRGCTMIRDRRWRIARALGP